MTARSNELRHAAIAWWRALRPTIWTEAEHLKEPTVNTHTQAEERLAKAVAEMVENGE